VTAPATQEHRFITRRSARYFTLGEPGAGVRDLWIACHGYGQLAADFLAAFEGIAAPGRLIAAPEGLSRFYIGEAGKRHGKETPIGASWMTRADRLAEIEDYVAYLESLTAELEARIAPEATLTVLGFSQGVSTVSRWIARSGRTPARMILWAGETAFDMPDGSRRPPLGVPVHLVGGSRDRLITLDMMEKQHQRLVHDGADASLHRFDGAHRMDRALLDDLAARA
jgi:predicted esterase